jgi:hypothetical protein
MTVDGIRVDIVAKKTINPKLWDAAKGKAYERFPLIGRFYPVIFGNILRSYFLFIFHLLK